LRFLGKGQHMKEETIIRTDTAVAPVLLTPTLVEKIWPAAKQSRS